MHSCWHHPRLKTQDSGHLPPTRGWHKRQGEMGLPFHRRVSQEPQGVLGTERFGPWAGVDFGARKESGFPRLLAGPTSPPG